MRIILFCPPVNVINGGIKQIFRLAEALIAQGFDAVVFEEQGRRPDWFVSYAPIVGQGIFQPRADEVLVLPEDQPQILKLFKDWPQQKVLYAQNHFYAALSLDGVDSFADYGIRYALCCSEPLFAHMKRRHPAVKALPLVCGIDCALFKAEAEKTNTILYMPRKRPVEAAYLRDMFTHLYPTYANWQWVEVHDKTETQVAGLMARAKVFLSLGRLESLGLTPLEAMASGCVVCGFTGIGGRAFANDQNGFWAAEDDFDDCLEKIAAAMDLALLSANDPARLVYAHAAKVALAPYVQAAFEGAVKAAFDEIVE